MTLTEKIMWTALLFGGLSFFAIQILPDSGKIEKHFGKAGLVVLGVLCIGLIVSVFLAGTCLIKLALGRIWGW
jgi:FtsH-binding integral membrane protein